jgi:hypothetical protein
VIIPADLEPPPKPRQRCPRTILSWTAQHRIGHHPHPACAVAAERVRRRALPRRRDGVVHPPLYELAATSVRVQTDHPQVAVRLIWVDGRALDDGHLVCDSDRLPLEGGLSGFVLTLQPARDDVLTAAPRGTKRCGVVLPIVGEQSGDVVRIIGVPGPDVAVYPGGYMVEVSHAAFLLSMPSLG